MALRTKLGHLSPRRAVPKMARDINTPISDSQWPPFLGIIVEIVSETTFNCFKSVVLYVSFSLFQDENEIKKKL